MNLQHKNAVIYGAGGSLGGAVAKTFAAAGARAFLINIRSGGSPDSRIFKGAMAQNPEVMEPVLKSIENDAMLRRMPLMADIANTHGSWHRT